MDIQVKNQWADYIQWTGDNFNEVDNFLKDKVYSLSACCEKSLTISTYGIYELDVHLGDYIVFFKDNKTPYVFTHRDFHNLFMENYYITKGFEYICAKESLPYIREAARKNPNIIKYIAGELTEWDAQDLLPVPYENQ